MLKKYIIFLFIIGGLFSPIYASQVNSAQEASNITTYQYWIDDDISSMVTEPYSGKEINLTFKQNNLAQGLHMMHFRMKKDGGLWSNTQEIGFYFLEKEETQEKETKQPIIGYRYGTNGQIYTKEIAEVDKIPSLDIEIPLPNLKDITNVEDYQFTFDNNSNEVGVKRNLKWFFFVQFKNKQNNWSDPSVEDSTTIETMDQTATEIELQRTLGYKKLGYGDFKICKFNIPESKSYYFGTSTSCKALLYKDNSLLTKETSEELLANSTILLSPGTYFAVIYDSEQDGSLRISNNINWVADPIFSYVNHQLTITCDNADATIHYTTDGSMPTSESPIYTGPIPMTYNARVKAIALHDGMADSFIKSFDVNDFETRTCPQPKIMYDGRKIKLVSEEPNTSIYYTEDGSNPNSENAIMYKDEGIEIKGLGSIKAIATKDLMNNSEVTSYKIPAYYDGKGQVEVQTAGSLSKAFEWNNGNVVTDTLQVLGHINNADVVSLRTMSGIKYLDLYKVSVDGDTFSKQAFANMNLHSASLPASLTTCGSELFTGNKQLGAVIWNANCNMPAEVLSGIDNPNLLLYVNTKSYAPASINNVVAGGIADNIVLSEPSAEQTSAGNFYVPQAFTAKKISYTRNFKQETEIGVCQGWETIALPFEAQTITHETNGAIAPFAKGDKEARPFWLYELAPNGGFQATATLKANTPYIISMPNSMSYSDEYILKGNVTFSATNAAINATAGSSIKNDYREFITTFEQIAKGDGIYALNVGEEYQGYRPGSIFADNYRDVKPFEAYLTTAQAAQAFSLQFGGGVTGIDNLPVKNVEGVKAWTNGSTLFIQSDKARKVMVFSTMGMLMKTVAVEAGETASVSDLPSGIYIVNNKKVAIKR